MKLLQLHACVHISRDDSHYSPPPQAASAWALGQIGRHTPEHAKAVAQANVLPRLLQLYLQPGSSDDLQAKVRGEREGVVCEFDFRISNNSQNPYTASYYQVALIIYCITVIMSGIEFLRREE